MALFNLLKVMWITAALITMAAVSSGLSLHKLSASLSNVRNLDEQIRLAYKPEAEEAFRPGRFLVDNSSDDDFIREDRTIKFPKLMRTTTS
ncbi:hypothetical protein Zmor_020824 [Zophobas morio]|uniref:Uncharacterized protein n=1 Tax=Zophobas morio TaxID=2755281 RepID=A0AA38I791_9CUCU|nr:hypothetical protein Zmor_020824 [Zophobas morio]